MNDYTEELIQAQERTRNVDIDGQVFVLKAHDPYGFWSVNTLKGSKPKIIDGMFTSYERAIQACNLAADELKKAPAAAAVVEKAPKVKRDPAEIRD